MSDIREHVMAGICHSLIVLESIRQNRKHLCLMARHLEKMRSDNADARVIALAAAKGMRAIADSLEVGEEANSDVCKCFGSIVKQPLSERSERSAPSAGASEGDNAAPESGCTTPATTCVPIQTRKGKAPHA